MKEKRIPKYRQVAALLAEEMERNGGHLNKTQLEIAEEHQVHRLTVRQALNWLEREGKVKNYGGRNFSSKGGEKKVSSKIGFPVWANSLAEIDVMRFQGNMELIRGAHGYLGSKGYELDVQYVGSKWEPNLAKIEALCDEWDAVILTPMTGESRIDKEHPFASMHDRSALVGFIQDRTENCVYPDFYAAGVLAIRELVAQGAKRILYTGYEREMLSHRLVRIAGVESAVDELKGINLLFANGGFHVDEAFSAVKRFFMDGGRCDAVLANSGYASMGSLRAMSDVGIRVPEDVQLLSIGRMTFWEYLSPRPTVVISEASMLGKEAARLALSLAQPGASPQPNVIVPVHLVRGETTLPLRTEAPVSIPGVRPEFQWI